MKPGRALQSGIGLRSRGKFDRIDRVFYKIDKIFHLVNPEKILSILSKTASKT